MKTPPILMLFALLASRGLVCGLATEAIGPAKSTVAQPGWPKGIAELASHPSRVYTVWVNGNENFYFQANLDEINELLTLFSKARMRDHEVRIEPGTNSVKSFSGDLFDYNVSLHVLSGIALHAMGEKVAGETLEPCLTIYAREARSLLKQLKLPANAVVHCEVEGAGITSKVIKPIRKIWYGRVQFEDGRPGVDLEHGLNTRITLWEKDSAEGIELAFVSHEGLFQAVFSDGEIAALKKGQSWLTVKLGNYAAKATPDDTRYPVELLAPEKEKAKPLKISRPEYYYGRVLFEDGSLAVLKPAPWPGAAISVDIPYSGAASLDAEGYFQVFLEPEQFEKLKSRKPSKNIYCPTEQQGQSRAMEIFPAELLAQDKSKAGIVKIPKPIFKPSYDPAKAPSLVGKPLPALRDLKLEASPSAVSNRRILLCFFDLQERPSRHAVAELVKQADDLQSSGIFIAGVQVSAVDRTTLQWFVRTNHVNFPVGMIEAEAEKTKFNWGLKSQPWLILTDEQHIVRAEGFSSGEVSEQLSR